MDDKNNQTREELEKEALEIIKLLSDEEILHIMEVIK